MERKTVARGFITAAFFVLYRALRACQKLDQDVAKELESLPENLEIIIALASQKGGIAFQNCPNGLRLLPEIPEGLARNRLEIRLKTVRSAVRLITGKENLAKSYVRGNILMRGEVRWGMALLRCLQKVENYLFPAFMRVRLFGTLPEKKVPSRLVYWNILFLRG